MKISQNRLPMVVLTGDKATKTEACFMHGRCARLNYLKNEPMVNNWCGGNQASP